MKSLIIVLLLFPVMAIHARDIYVNNLTGADNNSGLTVDKPYKTIKKAVSEVKPGDIIHLVNTGSPYKESLVLNDVNGTPENRITIDGNGSTLSGCQALNLSEWKEVSPGLYKNSLFYAANRFVPDYMRIYYFLFDGRMNRMGRSRKGPCAPFKKPGELSEKEWTFTESDSSFYIKINPAKKLDDYHIEQPVRSNAVAVSGNTSYVTVKNLICTHVYNDGFGLTGTAKKLRFENIQSHFCGDDGISAHVSVQYEVFGFVSIGNATGIADSGNSDTYYDGVVIKDCVGTDLFFINERPGEATHTIKNVLVLCNAFRPVYLTVQKPDGHMDVKMENVLIRGDKKRDTDSTFRMEGHTDLYTRDCSFIGLKYLLQGKVAHMENTVMSDTGNVTAGGADLSKISFIKAHG